MNKNKDKKMSERVRGWIATVWPILAGLCSVAFGGVVWGMSLENQIKQLAEKNYRLYLQFDEYKKASKELSQSNDEKLDNIALSVNTILTKLDSFDDRYVNHSEIDSRYLKTAYRND